MDFEKDAFEDDNEISRLEEDEEVSGDAGELAEAEEVVIPVTEQPATAAPAKKPARKKAKKAKKTKSKKKAKARPRKKAAKKGQKKRGKKAAKKRKKR